MRIAFSGAACTGKTTTINAFLEKWPNYTLVKSDYRKLIKKTKKHSKNATTKSQKEILDILVKEVEPYTLHNNVCFDRCALDNLVYTLWCHGKDVKGFDDKFIAQTIEGVKKAMRSLDILFIFSRDLMPPGIEKDGVRETDPDFVKETDNIFKAISKQAQADIAKSPFFPKNDSPAVIEIHGTTEERIAQISLYVTPEGSAFGEEQSILDINELTDMKQLLMDQKEAYTEEQKQKIGLLDINK
jgi:Ni2+-binding GTPase involved in maturation of urease and hydrogenase